MCNTDQYGFPVGHRQAKKVHFGCQTGDWVVADAPKGKYTGVWKGQVTVRTSGYFDIKGYGQRLAQGISHRYFRVLQRVDGWNYETKHTSARRGEKPPRLPRG